MTGSALTTTGLVPAGIKAGTAHMAFPIYQKVPPGCVPWPVMGDRHAPHLHDRDQALVDATDREIVWGEVYLVDQASTRSSGRSAMRPRSSASSGINRSVPAPGYGPSTGPGPGKKSSGSSRRRALGGYTALVGGRRPKGQIPR